MSRTSFASALVVLLITASGAFAESFSFTGPGNVTWNGVYVNPYTARDNTQKQDLTIYCDDWNTDFSGNPDWNANVYALTLSNQSFFRYGTTTPNYNLILNNNQLTAALSATPPAFDRYLEAAWLDEQAMNELKKANPSSAIQKELAAAGWTLFVDRGHVDGLIGGINSSGSTFVNAVYGYLQEAEAAVTDSQTPYTAAGWDVIVPVGNNSYGGPMQEFLTYSAPRPDAVTPEPSAVILLSTLVGLLSLVTFRRKRQA
jgi:hypothetical protein